MSDTPRTLSQLRQERGMSIEALAASLKVAPAKLLALESGRYDELPNAAFARSLAMSVCRVLKADAKPILATLPSPNPVSVLAEVSAQQPFKSGQARLNLDTSFMVQWRRLVKPRYVIPLLILAAAVALYNWPVSVSPVASREGDRTVSAEPAQAVPPAVVALPASEIAPALSEAVPALPPEELASAASAAAPALAPLVAADVSPPASEATSVVANSAVGGQGNVVIRATDNTWVQVKDASGELLLRRMVLEGERIALAGALPLKVKVGNATAVELTYQGQRVDLSEHTRANVARLELK